MLNKKSGITLIAIIVTVVILLILAGVAVKFSLGENGLIGKTKTATDKYKQAGINEQIELSKIDSYIGGERTISAEDIIELIKQYANPPGTVISYIGSTLPDGYLACDGTKYNVSDYPVLYSKLKDLDHTGWKDANWTTEFTVPDLRGEFLRGTGTNGHTNQGSGENIIGKHQDGTTSNYFRALSDGLYGFDNQAALSDVDFATSNSSTWIKANKADSGTGNYVTSYTSRPTNTSVLYCIKY